MPPLSFCSRFVLTFTTFAVLFLVTDPKPLFAVNAITMENGVKIVHDLNYTGTSDPSQTLDLYLPQTRPSAKLPVIVLIHGGGWSGGNKEGFSGVAQAMAMRGYACANLNYRLSGEAVFPAQIIDCKSAVRWLRAHAATYGLDSTKFVAAGHSAGGHLAALLGTTNGVKKFDRGENLSFSSNVEAVLWFAGVGDLTARVLEPGFESEQDPHSGESMFVGGPILQMMSVATAASPITYVSSSTPPFALFHGDSDKLVPVSQAIYMYTSLLRHGVYAELHILKNTDHGGGLYFNLDMFDQIDAFLNKTLQTSASSPLTSQPITGDIYKLVPISAPNLVLEAMNSSSSDGTAADLNVPTGAPNQQWVFISAADGYYQIAPQYDRTLSLTVTAGSITDKTPVMLAHDQGLPTQRWKVREEVNGTYILSPLCATGSGLEDFSGQTIPGVQTDIWNAGGGWDPHGQWLMTRIK